MLDIRPVVKTNYTETAIAVYVQEMVSYVRKEGQNVIQELKYNNHLNDERRQHMLCNTEDTDSIKHQ